jgi:hypothetical protein
MGHALQVVSPFVMFSNLPAGQPVQLRSLVTVGAPPSACFSPKAQFDTALHSLWPCFAWKSLPFSQLTHVVWLVLGCTCPGTQSVQASPFLIEFENLPASHTLQLDCPGEFWY